MDKRDKQLQRRMQMTMAAGLPVKKQLRWAKKCLHLAGQQYRTAFYMLASIWLANVRSA